MSLLDRSFEEVILLQKISVPDGEGGFYTEWQDGVTILAAIALDSSTAARIAQQQGASNIYTIITKKNANLQFHDVLKRVSDGKIFRVTSDGDDRATPTSAALNARAVNAEEWRLPQ